MSILTWASNKVRKVNLASITASEEFSHGSLRLPLHHRILINASMHALIGIDMHIRQTFYSLSYR